MSEKPELHLETGGIHADAPAGSHVPMGELDTEDPKAAAFLQAIIRQALTNSRLRIGVLMEMAPMIQDPVAGQLADLLQGLCQDVEDLVAIAVGANAFEPNPSDDELAAAAYVTRELTRIIAEHEKEKRQALLCAQSGLVDARGRPIPRKMD